jgi:outer membrane lipoprotein SlyB
MFGKQAVYSIASPMKDLKIKGGSFDMAGAAGAAGVAIGMLGSAIGKGDGDATLY